jgi:bifunctional non-homologous end joining protein LigD
MADERVTARFIEPMLLRPTPQLSTGPSFAYELKLDGFRAVAVKTGGRVLLRSRNNKDFNRKYPALVQALLPMPDETVIDGEVVALDGAGRPSFNALQNYTPGAAPLVYYVFDLMILGGRGVMSQPLDTRRVLLQGEVLPKLAEPIRESPELDAALPDLIATVKAHGLEGLVAKRRDSHYEPGQRSGAWLKMRVNRGQQFVIGGYTIGANGFDAVIFGYYNGDKLIYAGRTRNGFTPASREQLTRCFRDLGINGCPFANLPEATSGRWGEGLTADKLADCRWLSPMLVAQFEFVEWTIDGHLRHVHFVGLREGVNAREVARQS